LRSAAPAVELALAGDVGDRQPTGERPRQIYPGRHQLYYVRSPGARDSGPAGVEPDAAPPIGQAASVGNGQEDEAMSRIELEPVDRVEITLVMDNVTDPLLVDQEAIARMNWPKAILGGLPSAQARVSPTTGVPDALIAEPGFSALVRIEKAGRKRTLLFDTGVSPNGMVENMRRLAIDPADIEVIVLSHGHWDHVTGIEGLVRVLGSTRLPVMIHPEFWSRRRISFPGLTAEFPVTSRGALEEMGFEIVEERQPSFLLDGAVLITGEVDRQTPFETGLPAIRRSARMAGNLIR
jgi:7,8-dihydropterin-6-yl-methyl-4-(beta-D-ribofuranosyl)aminobenzene 5'-phosphate synthase